MCLLFSSFSVLSLFFGLLRSSSEIEEDEAALLLLLSDEKEEEEEEEEEDEGESATSRLRFFIFLRCLPSPSSLSSLLSRPLQLLLLPPLL